MILKNQEKCNSMMSLSHSTCVLCVFCPSYTPVPQIFANRSFSANWRCIRVARSITVDPIGKVKGSVMSAGLPGGFA